MAETQNPFKLAQAQFDRGAELLDLPQEVRDILRQPLREFRFQIPVRMDDGSARVFSGSACSTTMRAVPPKAAFAFTPMKPSTLYVLWPCG